jgi:His-Xaa-Ser system protein HxsD
MTEGSVDRPLSKSARFDQQTTDLDALQRAAYALAKVMTVDIRIAGGDFACVLSDIEPGQESAAESLLRREVFDQTLRVRIAHETEQVRNLIFAVAFSQTGLT